MTLKDALHTIKILEKDLDDIKRDLVYARSDAQRYYKLWQDQVKNDKR